MQNGIYDLDTQLPPPIQPSPRNVRQGGCENTRHISKIPRGHLLAPLPLFDVPKPAEGHAHQQPANTPSLIPVPRLGHRQSIIPAESFFAPLAATQFLPATLYGHRATCVNAQAAIEYLNCTPLPPQAHPNPNDLPS